MPTLDLEWLEDFLEVAEQRNFTRAAAARGLTQSTLSRRIQSLESSLGNTTLLRRDAGLTLTESGEYFKRIATKIVVDLRDARLQIERMAPFEGTRIYTLHSLAATFVPRVVHKIRELLGDTEYDINISIIGASIAECTEALASTGSPFISYENDKYRVLFSDDMLRALFPSDRPQVQRERILSVIIAHDRLIPVCATSNVAIYEKMLTAKTPIPFSGYSEGTYLSELVEDKIKALNLERALKDVGAAQMADTLRNIAREGDGIAWVLESTALNAIEKNEVTPFNFNTEDKPDIPLDIKLFRLANFTSRNVDLIWDISKDLERELADRQTWLTT
jgi:DNA-binding transcriptional LysR family regulator